MKQYIWVLFLFFLLSCDQVDSKFTIVNQSDKTISFYLTTDSLGNDAKQFFEESFFFDSSGNQRKRLYDYIVSKKSGHISILGEWDTEDNYMFKEGKSYLFVIDSLDIANPVIKKNPDNIIRRYSVTKSYMRLNNWVIKVK